MNQLLTSAAGFGYSVFTERRNSKHSGIRTRQTCGFFTSGHSVMAGRGRKHNTRKGNTARQLCLVSNLPAALPVRVETLQQGLSRLAQERIMTALTVLTTEIRLLDGLYSLNDLHQAAGGEAKHEPYQFMRNAQTQALVAEICKSADSRNYEPAKTARGKTGGTYVCKELVYAYAMWISPKFNLAVIRAFDAMQTAALPAVPSAPTYMVSERRAEASRENGKKGGRPRKDEIPALPAPTTSGNAIRPPVWTRPKPSGTPGAVRNIPAIRNLIAELKLWGWEELPREADVPFNEAMDDLLSLIITGWTEVDEALSHLAIGMNYLNRWQGRSGRIGNA